MWKISLGTAANAADFAQKYERMTGKTDMQKYSDPTTLDRRVAFGAMAEIQNALQNVMAEKYGKK